MKIRLNVWERSADSTWPDIRWIAVWIVLSAALALAGFGVGSAKAAPTSMVNLGQASSYAVLSGASVANTVSAPGADHTTIRGDLGVKASAEPSGFPPGVVTGSIRYGSSAEPAHADLASAYAEIAARPGGAPLAGALVGVTLTPGLHTINSAASNTGTLTLDGGGDPDAVFVIQVNGALAFAAGSQVVLTNQARASRVFWQVAGAGAIGALSAFTGTLIASDAIGMGNGTQVNGRAFARDGAITLDNNQFYGAPPVVTIDGGAAAQTTDPTPTVSGTTDLEAPSTVTVTVAGQDFDATPVGGSWSVTSATLANGTYPVTASVLDGAGNPGSASQQLTVDTVLPEISLDGGGSVTTSDATPTISGSSDVAAGTIVQVEVGPQGLSAIVQANGNWNVSPASLSDGTYAVNASVEDLAGNESTASQELTVDTTAPAVSITGGPVALTRDATPALSGTAAVPAGSGVTVTVANQTLTGSVGGNQAWSVTAATLSDGPHRFVMTVSDAAGNEARAEQMLTVDTVSPAISIDGGATATTADTSPTITGTSDAAPGTTISVSIAGQSLTTLVQAGGDWNVSPGFVGNGSWPVVASVMDPAGNTGSASQTLMINPRVEPPDTTDDKPVISGLKVTPKKASIRGGGKNTMRRLGPLVKLNLSEDARVRFLITRKFRKPMSFTLTLDAGANTVRIPKKIRKKLKPGTYRLKVIAIDSISQPSQERQAGFRVVR